MTSTTFDEPFDPDKDPYAIILAPAAPERAYERRQPTIDDLLDLRNTLADLIVLSESPARKAGLKIAIENLDNLLASL